MSSMIFLVSLNLTGYVQCILCVHSLVDILLHQSGTFFVIWLFDCCIDWLYCFSSGLSVCLSLHIIVWIKITKSTQQVVRHNSISNWRPTTDPQHAKMSRCCRPCCPTSSSSSSWREAFSRSIPPLQFVARTISCLLPAPERRSVTGIPVSRQIWWIQWWEVNLEPGRPGIPKARCS